MLLDVFVFVSFELINVINNTLFGPLKFVLLKYSSSNTNSLLFEMGFIIMGLFNSIAFTVYSHK